MTLLNSKPCLFITPSSKWRGTYFLYDVFGCKFTPPTPFSGDESDLVPLANTDSTLIQGAVTGLASRALVTARLTTQYKGQIQQRSASNMSTAAITTELFTQLAAQGTTQFAIANTASYNIDDEVRRNIDIWAGSSSVSDCKQKIAEVRRIVAV